MIVGAVHYLCSKFVLQHYGPFPFLANRHGIHIFPYACDYIFRNVIELISVYMMLVSCFMHAKL